jgi:hypothetical protein
MSLPSGVCVFFLRTTNQVVNPATVTIVAAIAMPTPIPAPKLNVDAGWFPSVVLLDEPQLLILLELLELLGSLINFASPQSNDRPPVAQQSAAMVMSPQHMPVPGLHEVRYIGILLNESFAPYSGQIYR